MSLCGVDYLASRNFAPNHPVCLQKIGTDCCEEYFSSSGSFIINKHNYTITDMFNNFSNMNYRPRLFVDEEGPENPKKHRKGENIWHKGQFLTWPGLAFNYVDFLYALIWELQN